MSKPLPDSTLAGPSDISKDRKYNRYAYEPMLHQFFNRLRARLMNLAESSTRDKQQAEAMKGLMKDFLNEAYYASLDFMESYARDMGVIEPTEAQCGPKDRLTAQGMQDILYEPEITK